MTEKMLDNRIRKLTVLDAQIKALEAEKKALEQEVKDYMGEKEECTTKTYIVKWTKYSSRRFDSKAFQKDRPKVYEKYLKTTESRRFSYDEIA